MHVWYRMHNIISDEEWLKQYWAWEREREREKEKIRHKKDVKLKLISYTYSAVKLNVNQSVMFCVFCIKKRCLRLKLFMIVIIVVSIPFFGLHIGINTGW